MNTLVVLMLGVILIPALLVNSGYGGAVQDDTIYTFSFGYNYKPYEFISESGDLMGFSVDIVRRVCELAEKKCAFIVFKNYSLCWDNRLMMAEGLNNRYWDVCSAYTQTKERMLAYGFLGMYADESPAYVFARAGTRFTEYEPVRHQIGFVKGSRLNPVCIKRRLGVTVPIPRYYDSPELLLQGLERDEINVAFTMETRVMKAGANKFRKVSERIRCGENGISLMMRKDMIPKYKWFDEILREKVLKSKYYTWACNIAKLAYGADPFCLKKEDIK